VFPPAGQLSTPSALILPRAAARQSDRFAIAPPKALRAAKRKTGIFMPVIQNQHHLPSRLYLKAQEAANCEANGTCGSKLRSVGPVYRELARQAELLRQEYMAAQAQLSAATQNKAQALAQWRATPPTGDKAGLLARVQALHAYTAHNTAALVAWVLFFTLVLFFELMVVLSKLVFGDTVDDELDRIRERISQQKARDYMEAVTSPVAGARALIAASYG
jgi:hypothetical protein